MTFLGIIEVLEAEGSSSPDFNSLVHIIGERVSAANPEIITEAERVMANSVNSLPVIPFASATGA